MFSEDNYGGNSISAFLDDYSFVDMIIKIGVLKVRDNKFVETFGTLINSRCVMFDFITQLTGINNDMVKRFPTIKTALPDFLDFIGNDVLVASTFDFSFLNDNSWYVLNKSYKNDFIDTLRISRRLFKDIQSHKLGNLIKGFNIAGFSRA